MLEADLGDVGERIKLEEMGDAATSVHWSVSLLGEMKEMGSSLAALQGSLELTAFISVLGYAFSSYLISRLRSYNLRANLYGLDLNKKGTKNENERM